MSIIDNVAYGLKRHYRLRRGEMMDRVEEALTRAAIWEEVKDDLPARGRPCPAARVSDYTAFFRQGRIFESGPTQKIFSNPSHQKTQEYITGRFG